MARRDPSVFAEFVAARSARLYRSAYLMVGDHGLAQDLVQEALTKTYVAWPRLREVDNAEAYARRVVTNTAISWSRRRSWHERPAAVLPEHAEPGSHGDELSTRDWLWRELQQLPPRQRAAIVLRYYEDLSEAATAEALGCAVGTVKSQVSTGLKRLRERVGTDALSITTEGILR